MINKLGSYDDLEALLKVEDSRQRVPTLDVVLKYLESVLKLATIPVDFCHVSSLFIAVQESLFVFD